MPKSPAVLAQGKRPMDRLSAATASAIVVAATSVVATVVEAVTIVTTAAEKKDEDDDPPAAVIVSEHEISPRKKNLYRLRAFRFAGMLYDMKTFRRWLHQKCDGLNDWRIL